MVVPLLLNNSKIRVLKHEILLDIETFKGSAYESAAAQNLLFGRGSVTVSVRTSTDTLVRVKIVVWRKKGEKRKAENKKMRSDSWEPIGRLKRYSIQPVWPLAAQNASRSSPRCNTFRWIMPKFDSNMYCAPQKLLKAISTFSHTNRAFILIIHR